MHELSVVGIDNNLNIVYSVILSAYIIHPFSLLGRGAISSPLPPLHSAVYTHHTTPHPKRKQKGIMPDEAKHTNPECVGKRKERSDRTKISMLLSFNCSITRTKEKSSLTQAQRNHIQFSIVVKQTILISTCFVYFQITYICTPILHKNTLLDSIRLTSFCSHK